MGKPRRYVSLLRGINVGKSKRISKDELTGLFESLDAKNIQVHIQSGNVVCESDLSPIELASRITQRFRKVYGYEVPAVILESKKLETIIRRNPYSRQAQIDPAKVLIGFPLVEAGKAAIAELNALDHSPNLFQASQAAVYVYCPQGVGRAKLPDFEKRLGGPITFRNVRVAQALLEMASHPFTR